MSAVLPESSLCLRPMQVADLSAVMQIEKAAYSHPWTAGIFQDCLRVGYRAWVLEWPGTLIGYGLMSIGAGEAHVLNLCVHPDYQGSGYGGRLLEQLLSVARSSHVHTVFLEVRSSNQAAVTLYNNKGFNQIGCRTGYYPAKGPSRREDALLFGLTL